MANKGRVIRELFLVGFVAAFIMPWGAATANFSAQLGSDVYGWEPLGLIAGSSELRMHSLGEDRWEVWACDTPGGTVDVDPATVASVLNAEVAPFYRWLSDGTYRPEFIAGETVVETSSCANAVSDVVSSEPNGVLIVTDAASNGGSAQSGLWCPYEGQCPASPDTYPANYRSVTVGAHAVLGSNPRIVTVVHEIGHTLHFGHTYSGGTTGTWAEYDNPLDVMSKAGDRTRVMGTLALNRYIAGWIEPEQVEVATTAGTHTITALGGSGTQLLLVPNGELGWVTAIDARTRSGYDAALPAAGVTVHVLDQRPEACGSSLPCFGLSRRVSPWPAEPDSYEHMLMPGDSLVLPNGWLLTVSDAVPGGFVVDLIDTSAPVFAGPAVATGIESSSVGLTWPAAVDDGPVSYEVTTDGVDPVRTTDTSVVLTGLAPDREYRIRVSARDLSGNAVTLDPVVVRTLTERDRWVAHDPGRGLWTFRLGEGVGLPVFYGVPGDLPLLCDWDGNGADSVGVYRPQEGFAYLRNTNSLGFADIDFHYGIPSDVPLCGDWDGDGIDSLGIYRPGEQRFYLRNANSLGLADIDFGFGVAGDVPLAGDWDGDGIDTVGVFRPATGTVHTLEGMTLSVTAAGELVVGDLVGVGKDAVATFAGGVIRYGAPDGAQQLIRFGAAGQTVLAGWWE